MSNTAKVLVFFIVFSKTKNHSARAKDLVWFTISTSVVPNCISSECTLPPNIHWRQLPLGFLFDHQSGRWSFPWPGSNEKEWHPQTILITKHRWPEDRRIKFDVFFLSNQAYGIAVPAGSAEDGITVPAQNGV